MLFLFIVPLCPALFEDLKIKLISILEHKLQGGFNVKLQCDSQKLQIHFWGQTGSVIFACCLSPCSLCSRTCSHTMQRAEKRQCVIPGVAEEPCHKERWLDYREDLSRIQRRVRNKMSCNNKNIHLCAWLRRQRVLQRPIYLLGRTNSRRQKALAADTKADRCMCKELKWDKLWQESSSAGSRVLLLWNGSCGKVPLCPLKEWHHLNFLSQKQALLGAVEIMLPGFLWLSILWLIIWG